MTSLLKVLCLLVQNDSSSYRRTVLMTIGGLIGGAAVLPLFVISWVYIDALFNTLSVTSTGTYTVAGLAGGYREAHLDILPTHSLPQSARQSLHLQSVLM